MRTAEKPFGSTVDSFASSHRDDPETSSEYLSLTCSSYFPGVSRQITLYA